MRKLAKLFLILSLVAVLASSLCVMASAATDTVSTFNQLYIGDYEQESDKYTGMAHVVFGTVSNTNTEFGILIEAADGKTYKFPGRAIADSGKFGVAIYQLPEGNYKAYAYSGTDDNRIVGDAAYFTANKATFTLTFDTSKTAGVTAPSSQTVAQGTAGDMPTVTIPASAPDGGTVGWVDAQGKEFDFDMVVTADTTVYSKWIADPSVRENIYSVNVDKGSSSSQSLYLMTSIPMDLSAGDTIYLEMDVLTSSLNVNGYIGFNFWQSLLSKTSTKGGLNLSGFYDTNYTNNSIMYSNEGDHDGNYRHSDHPGADPVLSGDFHPAVIFAAGKTVRMAYTAPTDTTNGSIYVYNKTTGADDSTYVLQCSLTELVKKSAVTTTKTYAGLVFYTYVSALKMTFTNYHVYTDSYGDIPAMYDYHNTNELVRVVPKYTVNYDVSQVSKTTISSQEIEEGNTITEPTVSTVATPVNGVLAWFDEDGNEFDFDTAIERNITLTARWIADKSMYDKVYDIQAISDQATFGSSTRTDLTGGKTLTMQFDILSSKIASANYNMSYFLKYHTNTADVEDSTTYALSYITSQHFSQMYANYVYYSPWQTKYEAQALLKSGITQGTGSNPVTYYAAGQTFKWVYKAPENKADGTGATGYMKMYTKPIGADDSAYTCVGFIDGLVCTGSTSTSHVHPSSITNAVLATDLRNMASNEMVITKVRLYSDDGVDLPWHWDTTTCTFDDVTADTNSYNVTVPKAGETAGFGGAKAQTVGYGQSLVYDFKVVESNLSLQDANGDGATTDNATLGYIGFAVNNGSSVSNWPGNMIYTNGSYSGIPGTGFGGVTAEKGAGCAHWWQLLQTGASVKVVYTRTSSASANDGSFIIYRKLAGETEYSVFVAYRGLADISGSGRINIMYANKYGARVLKLTDLATYVLDTNGNKVSYAGPLGTANLTFTAE